MNLYTDAGTKHNGSLYQNTRIAIANEEEVLRDEIIGNYTNNEGELVGVVWCLQMGAKTVFTDSQIAKGWVERGWSKSHEKSLRKGKLTDRHKKMIIKAHEIFLKSGAQILWIPRDYNLAGNYLEDTYHI